MAKVSVIGAGNVGASCVEAMLHLNFCSEIVLLDIKEGISEGKAMDMMQAAKQYGTNTKITGVTNDYSKTADSDVLKNFSITSEFLPFTLMSNLLSCL